MKSIADQVLEFGRRQRAAGERCFIVTARTTVDQGRMVGRKFSWVKERFIPSSLINDDGGKAGANGKKADEETRQPPKVDPIVIAKVALVSFADLLLRPSRNSHRRSVVEESYEGMPCREQEE